MGSSIVLLVAGALSAGYAVAALFFGRFWKDTGDRLFGFFTLAFGLLAAQRIALALLVDQQDWSVALYGVRLVAFLLILYGIIDKNRRPAV
jgi:hypothetical protein